MSSPTRGSRHEDPDSGNGIDTIWKSLGRLKSELRKMDQRLDGVGEDGGITSSRTITSAVSALSEAKFPNKTTVGAVSGGASMPGVSSTGDTTGSDVAKFSINSSSSNHSGARRKVNRLADEKSEQNRAATRGKSIKSSGSLSGREPVRANHVSHHHQRHSHRPHNHRQNQQQRQQQRDQFTQEPPASHGLREDSPKRVDFSRTHQLREVNWDGTYQDSLAYPTDVTLTNSRDIRETDINFLNFSRVPGNGDTGTRATSTHNPGRDGGDKASGDFLIPRSSATTTTGNLNNSAARPSGSSTSQSTAADSPPLYPPPPSTTNSSQNIAELVLPPATPSTSVDSLPSHHNIHQNNCLQAPPVSSSSSSTDCSQDALPSSSRPSVSLAPSSTTKTKTFRSSGKHGPSNLTSVDLKIVQGARTSYSAKDYKALQDIVKTRQTFPTTSTTSLDILTSEMRDGDYDGILGSGARTTRPPIFHPVGLEDDFSASGAVGGLSALGKPLTQAGDDDGGHSPRRPRPFKKAITADLKENEIMLKLKERLKQQRFLASSSSASGSNDTSLADTSNSMAPPPALPPREPLTGASAPPCTRKVAATHPSLGYRGFTTDSGEQLQTGSSRPNTKVSGGVKKKFSSAKRPQLQPKKFDTEGAALEASQQTPTEQRPKKVARLVASSSDKKSSKTGAKNIITTSSWRAGQELIMKELGQVPKVKVKSTGASQSQTENEDIADRPEAPEGAEARVDHRGLSGISSGRVRSAPPVPSDDPLVNDVVAKSKMLSEDTKNMLQELQLGNTKSSHRKERSPHRPPKRKAPKASLGTAPDSDRNQQPSEKTRHYDAESIRKFMAKQKAERLKRQHEEKMANQKATERKQQMMEKLAETQKTKVASSSRAAALNIAPVEAAEKKRHSNTKVSKSNKENVEASENNDDDSTLTGDTEEELTPKASPRGDKGDETKPWHRPLDQDRMDRTEPAHLYNPAAFNNTLNSTAMYESDAYADDTQNESTLPAGTTTIEFRGQKLNLDLDNVFSRFSQVVNQKTSTGERGPPTTNPTATSAIPHPVPAPRATIGGKVSGRLGANGASPFELGTSNAIIRTNEERKQAIKATAQTLQNRLAEERRKLEGLHLGTEPSHPHSTDPEYIPRYERIAGSGDSFQVFTSHLPGSQGQITNPDENEAASRIQAAFRGHSVRGALKWNLPSGQTLGEHIKVGGESKKNIHGTEDGGGGDASELTETSTFSEITATDNSDKTNLAKAAGNKRVPQRHRRHADGNTTEPRVSATNSITNRPVRPGYEPLTMPEPKADPNSVMSIFSRQSKYLAAGSLRADFPTSMASTSATDVKDTAVSQTKYVAGMDISILKQPVITHQSEQIFEARTASGQPIVATTRYTRLEAQIGNPNQINEFDTAHGMHDSNVKMDGDGGDDSSSTASESVSHIRSGFRHSHSHPRSGHVSSIRSNINASKADKQHSHKSRKSSAYTMSFESDEDEEENASATLAAGGSQLRQLSQHSGGVAMKKSAASASYNRQVSDAGQETDVSQMSEDEPRAVRSKLEGSTAHHHRYWSSGVGQADGASPEGEKQGRLSPNSLANKLSAGLNHLESMEESLRQVVGMERTRAVALAQQETVSVAQVLKSRQDEHNKELQQLQEQAHQEAREATQQLEGIRSNRPKDTALDLLRKEDNIRPESRTNTSRSAGRASTSGQEDLSLSPGNRRIKRSSATASLASVTKVSSSRDRSSASVKTAADSSRHESSDSSIRSASDADAVDSQTGRSGSVPEEIIGSAGKRDDDDEAASYSMSFDESVTDEESFRQVLPSESHRKELKQQELGKTSPAHDVLSSHLTPVSDLSSLFVGEDSFNKFTAEMVRQIMREEEYRAQHQAALLSLREKALKEKAKAELAWLQQLRKKPLDKGADDVFPNIEKREKKIRKNLQEQQEEIKRLQEANKVASQERQKLLQQHEEIAKIKQNTAVTIKKLKAEAPTASRLDRPPEVHTEDEVEEESDAIENLKDSKSDSEMYRNVSPSKSPKENKETIEKQRKLRLDQKYMTAREQRLYERKKQAKELLEWKRRLDAEEAEIYHLERHAIDVWGGKKDKDKAKRGHGSNKVIAKETRRTQPLERAATADDVSTAAISEHLASSAHEETIKKDAADNAKKLGKSSVAGKGRPQQTVQGSISEVISTQLSLSDSDNNTTGGGKSRSRASAITTATGATAAVSGGDARGKGKQRSEGQSKRTGSESSILEEVPSGTSKEKDKKKAAHDSSDDTIINSSANDDYADTFEDPNTAASVSASQRRKSPVGKLLPQGNSPLPTPWSRSKTGSESESEDSISHTETMSDASDYEVRIRQLSDELRRRRKEVEILKKERSKRKKEKFKAQETALKKQLDAYSIYIQQLKDEKDDLEHETPLKSGVKPQIKQPGSGGGVSKGTILAVRSPSSVGRNGDDSSSFEDMKDGTDSNQTSPLLDAHTKFSPTDDKSKKTKGSVSLMDRISEGSESDKSAQSRKGKATAMSYNERKQHDDISDKSSSSMQEVIEEGSHIDSMISSEKTSSAAFKVKSSPNKQTGNISLNNGAVTADAHGKDEDVSYSMDFSEGGSTLAQSYNKSAHGMVSLSHDVSEKERAVASGVLEAGEISEHIAVEEPSSVASATKSPTSVPSHPKFDFRSGSKPDHRNEDASSIAPPSTGIQESDSETESRVYSYHNSVKSGESSNSRPSSERSVGSLSYSAEDDEEDNNNLDPQRDLDINKADRTPQSKEKSLEKSLPPVPGATKGGSLSKATEEDISENISASLPSISERGAGHGSHSGSLPKDSQDILDNLLGYEDGERKEDDDDDDKTPVPTPREMIPLEEEEEENLSLLMTDPLADFLLGDRVLVWGGQQQGTLRYKGRVDFSPGIWAGVELDQPNGEHDGMQEGTRYFSCPPGHGVIVQGSDIASIDEQEKDGSRTIGDNVLMEGGRALDESVTTEEESRVEDEYGEFDTEKSVLPARDQSIFHSTPLASPQSKYSAANNKEVSEKPSATPVKHASSLLAEAIAQELETSLVNDSLEVVVDRIASSPNRKQPLSTCSSESSPPPLPETPPPAAPKASSFDQDAFSSELPDSSSYLKGRQEEERSSPKQKSEKTADGVMQSLLEEAITDMVNIKRNKAKAMGPKLNGDLSLKARQVFLSQKDFEDEDIVLDNQDIYKTDELDEEDPSDLVHRPASPIPGDTPTEKDRNDLNEDMAGLLGEYIDDEIIPQAGKKAETASEQQALECSSYSVAEDVPPVVPHTKEEISPIVSKAVDIFWTSRRYGENLDDVHPPADFLEDWEDDGTSDTDQLTSESRRAWKHMLFDLTGEIVRDIYQYENKPEAPVWQKAQAASHKFFKGSSPPTTVDALRPVVQQAINVLLDLNDEGQGSQESALIASSSAIRQAALVNKWNVRKKKDAVDAVLVSELAREEKGWVNYDDDELNLKMALADSLFDSLLADTVSALNGIYQRRQPSHI